MKKITSKIVSLISLILILFTGCLSSQVEEAVEVPVEDSAIKLMRENKIEEAKEKFLPKEDINTADPEDGNTVLHLAAKKNLPDACTFFILKGADPELKNFDSDTALHLAIKNSSVEAARAITTLNCVSLFSRGADGKTALDLGLQTDPVYYDIFITTKAGQIRDTEGQSIVHYFVLTKNLKAIESCVKKGLPLSVKDNSGKTPLDLAFSAISDEESVEIAAALIMGGAEEVETSYDYFQAALASRNLSIRYDDGQTPLHIAAIRGDYAIANYLLENNADFAVQDSTGTTPLHESIRYGNLDIARLLLISGANVNAQDNLGKTPIMIIPPKNKMKETYELLISYRADLNQKDMFGDTLIHNAAMMSIDTNTISLLVNNGADINARNKEGVTPLEIAVQKQDVNTVKLMTSNGADIHTKDKDGHSPLSLSMAGSSEMFEAVINEKNATSQDSEGNTPLHTALLCNAPLSKIQYIVSLTNDVNIRNREGNSALYLAALNNNRQVGELLLAKDADIFSSNTKNDSPLRIALKEGGSFQDWLITSKTILSTDGSGNTVLHYAAEWQYADAINSLMAKGADISARNANGETPLFNAAKSNNPNIIQLVVDGGADIQARDNLGSTAIHTAVRWDAVNAIDKLVELGININAQNSSGKSPLSESVSAGHLEMCKKLLSKGADPNSCDTDGVTVLMDAIKSCNKDVVQLLLASGANPNIQDINGCNAYHEAAYMGDKSIIRIIRKAGGNPLARDKGGSTPFSLVLNKNISVIKEVLGNSYNITDSDGNTPIHIVVKAGASKELLKTLISDGYPIDTRNSDGYTALNLAIEANNVEVATILLENGANPFQMIDKKGKNGVTLALDKNNPKMISNIAKYAGKLTDVQGNTILHYAAKSSSLDVVKSLLAYGLNKNVKNVSGDTPYTIAVRWKRSEIAEVLK